MLVISHGACLGPLSMGRIRTKLSSECFLRISLMRYTLRLKDKLYLLPRLPLLDQMSYAVCIDGRIDHLLISGVVFCRNAKESHQICFPSAKQTNVGEVSNDRGSQSSLSVTVVARRVLKRR